MKKFILALAALLMIPLSIMPADAQPTLKAQQSSDLLAALELAATLQSPQQRALGNEVIEENESVLYQDFDKTVQELLTTIKTNCIPASNITNNAQQQDTIKSIIEKIEKIDASIKNKNDADFKASMQQMYTIFMSDLIGPESTTLLGKIPWGTKKPYLQINSNMSFIPEQIRAEIIAILSFFWLKYNDIASNDIALTLNKKIFPLSPLKWAYYTSHAGSDKYNETINPQFAYYSRTEIRKIFKIASQQADEIIKYIERIMGAPDVSAPDKRDAIKKKAPDIAKIYQLLFQPKQTAVFFKLKPEFQDAYKILPSNEFDEILAITLCRLASIWRKIMEAQNNRIFDDNDTISLTYPTLWNYDKNPPEQISNMPFDTWANCTEHAGYNGPTNNKRCKPLLEKPISAPVKQNREAWTTDVKNKVASWFSGLIVTKQQPFDF